MPVENRFLVALLVVVLTVVMPPPASAQEDLSAPRGAAAGAVTEGWSILRDAIGDLERFLTSSETYVVLGLGLGAAAGLQRHDHRIAASRLNSELFESSSFETTFEAGETLGGTWVQLGGAVATYGVGKLTAHPRVAELGRDLIRVQAVNGALTHGLKRAVGRRRPDGTGRRSFPSGHASATFASAVVLHNHLGWKVGVPSMAVASYVAASRMSENRHYLSDVIVGAAIGLAAGQAVTFRLRQARFELAPLASPNGAGVQVAVVGF